MRTTKGIRGWRAKLLAFFCTHLADAGADTAVIRELAGHADIRTTTIYTDVNPACLEQAIAQRSRQRQGVRLVGLS